VDEEDDKEEGDEIEGSNKKKKTSMGTPGPKWKMLEDKFLCDSRVRVSINAIIDTSKKNMVPIERG
jgi:hypothetical protein